MIREITTLTNPDGVVTYKTSRHVPMSDVYDMDRPDGIGLDDRLMVFLYEGWSFDWLTFRDGEWDAEEGA